MRSRRCCTIFWGKPEGSLPVLCRSVFPARGQSGSEVRGIVSSLLHGAASLPVPLFIVIVASLVFISTGGIPVPISATLLVAGALATAMPDGALIWLALLSGAALSLSLRDLTVMWICRAGSPGIERLIARLAGGTGASNQPEREFGALPIPNMQRGRQWLARQINTTLAEVQQLCTVLLRRGWVAIALTRLSPLATPLDIAAGALRFAPLAFARGIVPGRFVYTALYLGAGAVSGRALQQGNLLLIIGVISTVLVVLMILPPLVKRWAVRAGEGASK